MPCLRLSLLYTLCVLLTLVLGDSIRHNFNKDKLNYKQKFNTSATGSYAKSNDLSNWNDRPRSRSTNKEDTATDNLLGRVPDGDNADWSDDSLFQDVESQLENEPVLGERDHNGKGDGVDESGDEWQRQVTGMLQGLSEGITGLKHTMINLKLQNHLLYKQIKRWQNKCGSDRAQDTRPLIETAALTLDDDAFPSCPVDYFLRKDTNMCYRFSSDRITWRMARERCRAQDADLVSIDSTDTQQWINSHSRSHNDVRHCDFWTGGNDRQSEGQWHWSRTDRLITYHNWNHDEPNNSRGDEHCMQMLWVFAWRWNDARCNYDNACYICEKPLRGRKNRPK